MIKTALIGFGKIAQGNSSDAKMTASMQYNCHAQVLRDHPAFLWLGVVEPDIQAQSLARFKWQVPNITDKASDLKCKDEIELLVLATPPEMRTEFIKEFPALKAVLVEKPLGIDEQRSQEFIDECKARNIKVQVNFLRRADESTRRLAQGELHSRIGGIQSASGVYGRGIRNNGVHIVDLARLMLGEVESVQAGLEKNFAESPLADDYDIPFIVNFKNSVTLSMHPLQFGYYRENGIEFWGEKGKLSYLNSGFNVLEYPVIPSKHVTDESELDYSTPVHHASTMGKAFYEMYSNLADCINNNKELFSSGDSAMRTSHVVESIIKSAKTGGQRILFQDENA